MLNCKITAADICRHELLMSLQNSEDEFGFVVADDHGFTVAPDKVPGVEFVSITVTTFVACIVIGLCSWD